MKEDIIVEVKKNVTAQEISFLAQYNFVHFEKEIWIGKMTKQKQTELKKKNWVINIYPNSTPELM